MNTESCHERGWAKELFGGRSWSSSPGWRQRARTVYVLDPQGIILETNEAVMPLTGFEPPHILGSRFQDYLDPLSAEHFSALLLEPKQLEGRSVEALMSTRDGQRRRVRQTFFPLWEESGRLSGLVVHVEPAFPLLEAEPEEITPVSDYDELLDQVSDAVIDFTPERVVTFINRAGREIFGYTLEDLEAGLTVSQLFDPYEAEKILALLTPADGQPGPKEAVVTLFKRRDGRRFLGRVQAHLLREAARAGHWRLVISDLSAPNELARLGRTLEYACGLSQFCFALLDAEGRLLFADSGFLSLLGVSSPAELEEVEIEKFLRSRENGQRGPSSSSFSRSSSLPAAGPRSHRTAVIDMGSLKVVVVSR